MQIDLISPAMNLETETLSVGRGGPLGFPGKGKSLTIKFSYLETVVSPAAFTVSFNSDPSLFENIPNKALSLGGTAGQESTNNFSLNATDASVNGRTGTLTIKIVKDSDQTVFSQIIIKLSVQKA
jgi:hypothetical protein